MPIMNPSQFQCDQMQPGDVVYVKSRNLIYKLIRELFLKDKIRISVRKDFSENTLYNIYYQEDCMLLQSWEMQCLQHYDEEVPYILSLNPKSNGLKNGILKSLKIGLYNIQIVFKNNITFTIPTNYFDLGLRKNEIILKEIDDNRKITESLKYQKYKGYHFKDIVKKKNIIKWTSSYCSVCGNPIIFHFKDDVIDIENNCNCGTLKQLLSKMNYDEFALWYINQTNPNVKKIYDKFWFDKEY